MPHPILWWTILWTERSSQIVVQKDTGVPRQSWKSSCSWSCLRCHFTHDFLWQKSWLQGSLDIYQGVVLQCHHADLIIWKASTWWVSFKESYWIVKILQVSWSLISLRFNGLAHFILAVWWRKTPPLWSQKLVNIHWAIGARFPGGVLGIPAWSSNCFTTGKCECRSIRSWKSSWKESAVHYFGSVFCGCAYQAW